MKPKTRLDNFLAKIAKDPEADSSMEPKSREEHYLNKIAENGGSGGGYTVTEEHVVVLPEQIVTTAQAPDGTATYVAEVTGYNPGEYSELIITYNGQSYTCSNKVDGSIGQYGADFNATTKSFDFTSFPFALSLRPDGNSIVVTETATEVSIKAESVNKNLEITDDFADAVKTVASSAMIVTGEFEGYTTTMFSISNTVGEILDAYDPGKNIRLRVYDTTTDFVYEMPLSAIIYSESVDRFATFQTITKNSPYYMFKFYTSDDPTSDECHLDVYDLTKHEPIG